MGVVGTKNLSIPLLRADYLPISECDGMKTLLGFAISFLCFSLLSASVMAASEVPTQKEVSGKWCLRGVSFERNGELTHDGSIWLFSENGKLEFTHRNQTQKTDYSIKGREIVTVALGAFSVITFSKDTMLLHNQFYYHFQRETCDQADKQEMAIGLLIEFAGSGRIDDMRGIIDKRVDVNSVHPRIPDKHTALMAAARHGQVQALQLLIDAGAKVDLRDASGRTALFYGVGSERSDAVLVIIKAGADVNAKDNNGKTPLVLAVEVGNRQIVQQLILAGADLDVRYQKDGTSIRLLDLVDLGSDQQMKDLFRGGGQLPH